MTNTNGQGNRSQPNCWDCSYKKARFRKEPRPPSERRSLGSTFVKGEAGRAMKRIACIPFFVIIWCYSLGLCQDTKIIDKDLENIAGLYAECAAYYRFVYFAMKSSNHEENAGAYRQLEDAAMLYSLLLASEGRSEDVAVEVTNARIEMFLKKMKQDTNNRNENIAILMNRYQFDCQEAMKNPSAALSKVLKRTAEKTPENDDLTCECLINRTYKLNSEGELAMSGFQKHFEGKSFIVSRKTGVITGHVLTTVLAEKTRVINFGSDKNAFKTISEFDGQIQLLEIQLFVEGSLKPFIASSMGGAGIVTGICKCKE